MTKGIESEHWNEVRALIRNELQCIAAMVVKEAIAKAIKRDVLSRKPPISAHPKHQSNPKRPRHARA